MANASRATPSPWTVELEHPQSDKLEEKLHDLEAIQKATFNILEDFSAERQKLAETESAVFNILEDFHSERTQLEGMQQATLNLLEDFAEEKARLESTQSASFNILEDFALEKDKLEETQRATYNILEDFVSEREKLKELQNATFNILEDLNSEKSKLATEVTVRRRAETDLENANRELESFSYSVSHDLRAPLRGIDGFSHALLKDYGSVLDETGKEYLKLVRESSQRMAQLIDDLLNLSRMSRGELQVQKTDLSQLARAVIKDLRAMDPARRVSFISPAELEARCDSRLIRVVFENLLGNAWKFTSERKYAEIELGLQNENGEMTYFIRDNGAGFDMTYGDKLFGAFQRLHTTEEFAGTGIGLATVRRIIHRHGGRVWAEGVVGQGATFYFTLAP